MRDLGRRRFLTLAAALAPFGLVASPPAAAAVQRPAPFDIEAFLALSRRLTGRQALDRQVARTYLSALLTEPANADRLRELARSKGAPADRSQALVDLEQEIVEAWYTGVYRVKGTKQLATHGGALMWTALSRPAPGVCASAPGAWARPRAESR
jgi:hypothetical protein